MVKKVSLFFILLFLIFFSGCASNEEVAESNEQNKNDRVIQVKNSTTEQIEKKSGQEIAEHLVDLATSIPNVNDATAVVIGKYAVVGIDVNSKLDRSRVGTIKYSVAESLKKDPYGANAVVIADPDTNVRLSKMAEEIQDGRPVVGIMNELADIVGRVIPEIPSDIIENNNSNPTEQNENQLSGNEEQQLDKEQQDQSKSNLKD